MTDRTREVGRLILPKIQHGAVDVFFNFFLQLEGEMLHAHYLPRTSIESPIHISSQDVGDKFRVQVNSESWVAVGFESHFEWIKLKLEEYEATLIQGKLIHLGQYGSLVEIEPINCVMMFVGDN